MVFTNGKRMANRVILMTTVLMTVVAMTSGLPILSGSGRILAETDNTSDHRSLLDDTVRVDPLDSFNKYRGGYDLTNVHYWSSTVFTGIPGYAIAVLWILCGLIYGGYLLATTICCKRSRRVKRRSPCPKQCLVQPLLFAIFFTLLTIAASGMVLGGSAMFHSRARRVIDIIIDTADQASDTIYNTTGAMRDMNTSLRRIGENAEATTFLTSTSRRLDNQAADIERQASRNRRAVDNGLKIVYIVTTVIVSLTLTSAVALLAFGVLKFQKTLQVLIAFCWFLTVICWLFFGIYFFLHNFAGDTCKALESFQQDPYNNSLSSILPCDELLSARSVLDDVSAGIYDMVNEVNENISMSYGNIVQICNPFSEPPSYEYQPWNCPATSIQIGDIPQLLRLLACPDSEGGTCNGGILVPASYYNTVEAYSNSIQTLLNVYPSMDSLLECQTVSAAFSEILQHHCKPLKRNVRLVWGSLVFLSVVMMALVLVWIIGARHEQNNRSLRGAVKPHSNTADHVLELGTAKSKNDESEQI